MNDYHVYNSNFLTFLAAMIWKGITEGVFVVYEGLRYFWEPACKRCVDKETQCIARKDPCSRQRSQKNSRLITTAVVIIVPLMCWLLVNAIKKDNATREREKQIQQLLDAQKSK